MRQVLQRFLRIGTGHDSALWPVLLLLLIVLVPSAGVVWMMRAAMENERLAARQKLAEAYRVQLDTIRRSIEDEWRDSLARLDRLAERDSPQQAFKAALLNRVDSVVILDHDGNTAYPSVASGNPFATPASAEWQRAEELEFGELAPAEAAKAYAAISASSQDPSLAARARQAEARALVSAGDRTAAIQVLEQLRQDDTATDVHGRLLAADAELRLLQLLERDSNQWREIEASLACRRLNSYESPLPAADQRRFLMREMKSLGSSFISHALTAEDLAAEFVANPTKAVEPGVLAPTNMPDVSQMRSPSGRVIALVTRPRLRQINDEILAQHPFPAGVVTQVRDASQVADSGDELVAVSLAPTMPSLRLSLALDGAKSFDAAADTRMAYLLVTGLVVVALTAALALLVAGMFRRQSRLTRLKNDLVATVSHELKTPLASIRLLVDTLLDADGSPDAPFGDHVRAREYLELIAKENMRLSRLIDNFLTFSRMERGKHRFDFQPTDGAAIVDQAVAAVADRFDGVTNRLTAAIDRPLPLAGDVDALVTVVVNLLDNAWKYSDEPKQIAVAAKPVGNRIAISVTDNGIGLSPRAVRKVFDRFYQVDQHLSRSHDGCGLGLSIVKYIVEAHGGEVAVESRLGDGTTFTVSLPADATAGVRMAGKTEPAGIHA